MKRGCVLLTKSVLIIGLFFFLPLLGNAQPGSSIGDPDAPIDGGIGLLLAAGVGYGIKKANDKRKRDKPADLSQIDNSL